MKTARSAAARKRVPPLPALAPSGGAARLATCLLMAGALVGCGSTAGIRRTDGNVVEAKIVGSDSEGLQLQGASGRTYRMEGRSIVDVDHPGNVAMVAGALLLAEFAALMTSSDFRRELIDGPRGDGMVAARPLTALFGVPGALLLGYGTYRYASSKSAAAAFERAFEDAAERPLPSASTAPRTPGPAAAPAALSPPPPKLSLGEAVPPTGAAPCGDTRLATFCPGQ